MFRRKTAEEVLGLLKNDAERTYNNYETMLNGDLMDQLLIK